MYKNCVNEESYCELLSFYEKMEKIVVKDGLIVAYGHIGVVEDDLNIQNIVSSYLKKEGYHVTVAGSAEEGLVLWETENPNMWIIDIMLPGMDGFEFCRKIRDESEVPIIIISAKDEEIDKILGLELGGDDYLTKPFSPRELVARVKRLFKRTIQSEPYSQEIIVAGELSIYPKERRVYFGKDEIEITNKEFELLSLLAGNPNYAFSREAILEHIWGGTYFGSDRAVDDIVKRIRKKISELNIETVWGYGYRLGIEENDA